MQVSFFVVEFFSMKNTKILIFALLLSLLAGVFGGFVGAGMLFDEENESVVMYSSTGASSDLVSVIDRVMPSVVSVVVSVEVPLTGGNNPYHDRINETEFYMQEISGGTGFIVSDEGMVLTNKHVLDAGDGVSYTVRMSDATEYPVAVVGVDPFDDVAVLQIISPNGSELSFSKLEFADSGELSVGEDVFAIGNALAVYGHSVTSGIISAKGREVVAYNDVGTMSENLSNLLQTDAAINLGNSGGPLMNADGDVVGMNVAIAESANDIGFAIPANDLIPVLSSIAKFGEIVKPVIGVRFIMLTEEQAEELDSTLDAGAILIGDQLLGQLGVTPGGAADKAGLREFDVIVEIAGEELTLDNPLHKVVRKYTPGTTVELKIWRDGEFLDVDITFDSANDL
jgi:serine protease Do